MSFAFVFQISLCGHVDVFISSWKLLMQILAMASVASPIIFKEFCPLYYLLNAIPTKIQKGFRSIVVYLTALDTNGDYIAVGSSIGMLYLYCRHLNQMKKYNFEVNTNFYCCLFWWSWVAQNWALCWCLINLWVLCMVCFNRGGVNL